ncbi:MAG: thioredoxin domain-containing protein [Anaerolineaceae bacterium]|nr:thioredoxin domain-containing protein [Anaerolineaceae bacterium]
MENLPPSNPNLSRKIGRRPRGAQVHVAFLPLLFLIGLGVGFLVWSRPAGAALVQNGASDTPPIANDQQSYKRYVVPVDDDPTLGPDTAPITLIMYSDYECPFCQKWYHEVFKQLVVDYQGKIRFVYKDFPLYGKHNNAAPAAEAANCAGDQGKYWEYQDKLFGMTLELGAQSFIQYAADLSLDPQKFSDCLTSRKYQQEVQGDYDFATSLGVQSTPTFFINGLPVIGAQPIDVFKNIIDDELAGKIPKS